MGRLLLAFVCGALVVQAQVPTPKKTRMEGRVVGLNGEAVRKATVRLQGSGQGVPDYSKTTDDAGKFVFEDVGPGRYTLIAEKTGFLTQRYGARAEGSPGVTVNVVAGAELKDLDVKMTPQGVITGRVTDEDGDPIANAQVSVARYGYANGRRTLIQTGGALSTAGAPVGAAGALAILGGGGGAGASDDQGNFRVVNLTPGRYYVSANPAAGAGFLTLLQQAPGRAGVTSEPINTTTFYPNSLDAQGAAPVDVAGGSEVSGVNIRVRKERVYSIRGKVIDGASGSPAPGAMVMMLPPDASEANPLALLSNMSRTGPDGSFEIRNLLPGRYMVQGLTIPGLSAALPAAGAAPGRAAAFSPGDARATTRIEVAVSNADVTGAVLQLSPGMDMPGTITVDGGGKLSDVLQASQQGGQQGAQQNQATAISGLGARSIRLIMSEGVNLTQPSGNYGEDGAFKITGVYPAKYFVNVAGLPQGTYVKSVKFAGQDITRVPLDMTSGTSGSLEVELSAKAADFTGAVRNEKGDPLQGVPVTLWPKVPDKGKQDAGIKTANTDQNGSFKMSGLAPGEYYVAAWDDIPVQGLTQNPDFLARFAGDQSAVKLVESGHQSADVKLIARDRIVAEAAKLP